MARIAGVDLPNNKRVEAALISIGKKISAIFYFFIVSLQKKYYELQIFTIAVGLFADKFVQ